MSKEKREQVLALGRLGWPLRRIEEATGVRRETASAYPEGGRDRGAVAGSLGTASKTGQRGVHRLGGRGETGQQGVDRPLAAGVVAVTGARTKRERMRAVPRGDRAGARARSQRRRAKGMLAGGRAGTPRLTLVVW